MPCTLPVSSEGQATGCTLCPDPLFKVYIPPEFVLITTFKEPVTRQALKGQRLSSRPLYIGRNTSQNPSFVEKKAKTTVTHTEKQLDQGQPESVHPLRFCCGPFMSLPILENDMNGNLGWVHIGTRTECTLL